MAPGASELLLPGPWRHRDVSANGCRFHLAEAGDGPLVVLLHGFPQLWWAWRAQLAELPHHGLRAVAPDLRGYGASDKPPRGYDAYTLASDVAGMIRALGERRAIVVGHDWGGWLAFVLATLHPEVVERLVVLSTAHPIRLRNALAVDPRGQLRASGYLFGAQAPVAPEKALVRDDAARIGELLRQWGGPGYPSPEEERVYRTAIQVPPAMHCSLEYYRWALRSVVRPEGFRFYKQLQAGVAAPTLQLHGSADTCVLPRTALGSGRYVHGTYEWRLLEDAGHFLPEERPDAVTAEIIRWAKGS